MEVNSPEIIQRDWDERQFSETVILYLQKCTDIMNNFGKNPVFGISSAVALFGRNPSNFYVTFVFNRQVHPKSNRELDRSSKNNGAVFVLH